MTDRNSKNIGYPSQFAIFLGLTSGGWLIGGFIALGIWKLMTGSSILAVKEELFNPKYYTATMVFQGVSTFLIFFVPVYFLARICYHKPLKYLGFNSNINFKQVVLVICILILTFPLSAALGELNKILPIPQHWANYFKTQEAYRDVQESALIQLNSFPKYLFSLFIIAFLPAVFEETFFRAGMQQLFIRWFKGPWIAIIVTSIIFSLVHLSYYGFIVRFGLGVILGFVFYYSRNLWLNILLHFLYNGIQLTILYVYFIKGVKVNKDADEHFPLWAGAMALAVVIWLFTVYKKTSEARLASYNDDSDYPEDPLAWTRAQT